MHSYINKKYLPNGTTKIHAISLYEKPAYIDTETQLALRFSTWILWIYISTWVILYNKCYLDIITKIDCVNLATRESIRLFIQSIGWLYENRKNKKISTCIIYVVAWYVMRILLWFWFKHSVYMRATKLYDGFVWIVYLCFVKV